MPFQVPNAATQYKAIGVDVIKTTSGFNHTLQLKHQELYLAKGTPFKSTEISRVQKSLELALDPIKNSHLFENIPAPRKSDWLAQHEEWGQTFENYATSGFNKVGAANRDKIYLVPLGNWDNLGPEFLQSVEEYAVNYFTGMTVSVMKPVSLENKLLVSRINEYTQQEQYRTKELMKMLEHMIPSDAYCICGITFHDLYPDDEWNFVFGIASLKKRTGLYSFARYDPAFFGEERKEGYEKAKLLRTVKVMTHEICHQFGISHCIYYNCLMNGSNHQEESDRRPPHECPVCLRKLQYAIGFDIADRYTNLVNWFNKHGYAEEVSWLAQRLAVLYSDGTTNDNSGPMDITV